MFFVSLGRRGLRVLCLCSLWLSHLAGGQTGQACAQVCIYCNANEEVILTTFRILEHCVTDLKRLCFKGNACNWF